MDNLNSDSVAADLPRRILEDLRRQLIDRTRRNRLLHFRHSARSTLVRVVDEVPDQVSEHLAEGHRFAFEPLPDPEGLRPDERTPRFQAALIEAQATEQQYLADLAALDPDDAAFAGKQHRAERTLRDRLRDRLGMPSRPKRSAVDLAGWARQHGVDPSLEMPFPSQRPMAKHTDGKLQTLVFPEQLQSQLKRLESRARLVEQETGASTLHLSFGFLEWFESSDSDESLLSPLVLLPVRLEWHQMRDGSKRLELAAQGAKPETNLSLELRLREMRLSLPDFEADINNPIETYFAAVTKLVDGQHRWRVRRFLTLATFSFARIAMYRDLDRGNWAAPGEPALHPLVQPILQSGGAPADVELAETDRTDDESIRQLVPVQPLDTDSSQVSAIAEVMRGRTLVIQGPPGTGKSQTIVNIIANLIFRGKTVLFVSEKMAALEVVKSRLDQVDLGQCCLTLHAIGAKPAAVIESLRKRVGLAKRREQQLLDSTRRHRETIDSHLSVMHRIVGPSGETVHALIGRLAELSRIHPHLPRLLRPLTMQMPESFSGDQVLTARELLESLEMAASSPGAPVTDYSSSPFIILERTDLFPDEQANLLDHLELTAKACEELDRTALGLSQAAGITAPTTLAAITHCAEVGQRLPDIPSEVLVELLPGAAASKGREALAALVEAVTACRQTEVQLRAAGISDPASLAEGQLAELASRVDAFELQGMTIEAIERMTREAASDLRILDQSASAVADLCAALGLSSDPDLTLLDCLAVTAELASDVAPSWGQRRRPGLERHHSALQEIRRRAKILATQRRQIGEVISLAGCAPTAFRDAASALIDRSSLRFFSARTRRAKRFVRERWRGNRKPKARVLAGHLVAAAHVVEELHSFRLDPSVTSLFGVSTDPGDPVIEQTFLAASWQVRLGSLVAKQADGDTVVAKLTVCSPEVLACIASFPLSARELCRQAVEAARAEVVTWNDLREFLVAHAAALATLVIDLGRAGIRRDFALPLHDLDEALASWHSARKIMRSAALDLELAPPWPSEAGLGATLRFVSEVIEISSEMACAVLAKGWPGHVAGVREAATEVSAHVVTTKEAAARLQPLGLDRFVEGIPGRPLRDVCRDIRGLVSQRDLLGGFLRFAGNRAECLRNPLARAVIVSHEEAKHPFTQLPHALDWLIAWTMVRRQAESERDIFMRSGDQLDGVRRSFADLDRAHQHEAADATRAAAIRRPVPPGNASGSRRDWTDGALLNNEFTKIKRHIAVRDLMGRASGAVQALAPCMMMSPLTVAQYLPAGRVHFDVVIMDEASQIRPAHAIGALLRARQAVIVGDPKQLPPTDFFERGLDDEESDEDAATPTDRVPLPAEDRLGTESILDAALGAFQPARRLLWHYRSRHESLIDFSNRTFYDASLIVSPSPEKTCDTLGIELIQVEGTRQDRRNMAEAMAVIEAIELIASKHQNFSIGVVAMNVPQRDLIAAELDSASLRNPVVEKYREKWQKGSEPLFVKNLENVQGDERDIIIVSLGWGRTPQGLFYQRFSPVSRDDGHRRLNVLFTRAKCKVLLFASFQPEDIRIDEKTPFSVKVLRDYLIYARDGVYSQRGESEGPAESPFEESVAKALQARGHNIALQVGVTGYRVDLAVRDPRDPSRYLLGIECDGATYHSARSARDRDRLRQDLLEGLGWKLIRVWSTDWFRDPEDQTDRLDREIRRVVSEAALRPDPPVRLVPHPSRRPRPRPPYGATVGVAAPIHSPAQTEADPIVTTISPAGDLTTTLRDFREGVIFRDLPGAEPGRCILRDEIISVIVAKHLDDPEDWFDKVPEWMRSRTDGRQKARYLDNICDLVAEFPRPPAD